MFDLTLFLSVLMGRCLTLLHIFCLRYFLQGQVVTGMEAEQIIESLANYLWFLRVPNAVCISHLRLIDRRVPVDL